jgi:tetratricopeptide (TPR) repeat protein
MGLLLRHNALDEAHQLLRKASRQRIDPHVRQCLGGDLLLRQNNPRAVLNYMAAVAPESPVRHQAMDGLLACMDKFPDIMSAHIPDITACIEKLVDEDTQRPYCLHMAFGSYFAEKASFDFAIKHYRRAMAIAPAEWQAYERLGYVYEVEGNPAAARNIYISALRMAPESSAIAARLDALLAKEDNNQAAITFWRTFADAYPDTAIPLLYLGSSLERAGENNDAHKAYTRALRYSADHPEILFRLGTLEITQGHLDEGADLLLEAAKKGNLPTSYIAWRCREQAASFIEKEQYSVALQLYQAVLDVAPEETWLLEALGDLRLKMGDKEAAAQDYQHLLLSAPDSPVVFKLEALLRDIQEKERTSLSQLHR